MLRVCAILVRLRRTIVLSQALPERAPSIAEDVEPGGDRRWFADREAMAGQGEAGTSKASLMILRSAPTARFVARGITYRRGDHFRPRTVIETRTRGFVEKGNLDSTVYRKIRFTISGIETLSRCDEEIPAAMGEYILG